METGERLKPVPAVRIERPTTDDVDAIYDLIASEAARNELLPVDKDSIYESLRDFFVARRSDGTPIGTVALHVYTWDLAEVRSYCVAGDWRGCGVGGTLLRSVIDEARFLRIGEIFALTRKPELFEKFGFKRVDKTFLPHKVWKDCLKCPKLLDCDEVAVLLEI